VGTMQGSYFPISSLGAARSMQGDDIG